MLIAVIAYILGSLPLGFLLRRLNALHLPPAMLSVGADLFSGIVITFLAPKLVLLLSRFGLAVLAYPLANEAQIRACALIFALLGHYFSVYVCGWGGLGTALLLGGFLILTPSAALLCLGLIALVLLIFRRMKYASLAGGLSLPFLVYWQYPLDWIYVGTSILAAAFLTFTHIRFLREEA